MRHNPFCSHEPRCEGDGCNMVLAKLHCQAPQKAHGRLLRNIVEATYVLVVIPRDCAEDEAGLMWTLGSWDRGSRLDHEGNRKMPGQNMLFYPALDHCIPQCQRRLPKVAGQFSNALVASPAFLSKKLKPTL